VALISGMLVLLERLMIGRRISLPHSSACIQLVRDGKVKTSFGRPPPKNGYSMLDLCTVFCLYGWLSFPMEGYLIV
jgi:hypothetical protein